MKEKFLVPLLYRNESIIPVCYAVDNGFFDSLEFEVFVDFHDKIWADHEIFTSGKAHAVRGDFSRFLKFKKEMEVVITHNFTRDFQLISRNKMDTFDGKNILISKGTSVEFYTDLYCKLNSIEIEKISISRNRVFNNTSINRLTIWTHNWIH